jgi:fumarylacetoacetase
MAVTPLDETHDPQRRSWVESANTPGCDFPIQNLPLGVFRRSRQANPELGAAIGDFILPLGRWLAGETLNNYCALTSTQRRDLRRTLCQALSAGATQHELVGQADVEMLLPCVIGDYSDFYASIHHATNVGSMFRPGNPLLPNYRHVPIAYHGRASSVVVSGTPILRPNGQVAEGRFGPTKELDYELELGFFVGPGNVHGEPIRIAEAEKHIVGFCLVNDWSARDIQSWEYQPLGPFLAKSFATSISAWLTTIEALAPFRADPVRRDAPPLPYLEAAPQSSFEIHFEVSLKTNRTSLPVRLSQTSFRHMYWTPAQMLAHHTSNGCNLRPGDLIASGTVSGAEKHNRGCLLELTSRGSEPVHLPSGETRVFLEDGDEIILKGFCRREGFAPLGLGFCTGQILPARNF